MSYTKKKQKEYNIQYYQIKRKKIIDFLGGKCAQCGSTHDLEIDHKDWRTKSFSISQEWSKKSWLEIKKELNKCQLLCEEHHRIKTSRDQSEQKTKEPKHGTIYAWMKRKCNCQKCLNAKRQWYDKRNVKRRVNGGKRELYGRPSSHGTILQYRRGCHCQQCRDANAAYARKLRINSQGGETQTLTP